MKKIKFNFKKISTRITLSYLVLSAILLCVLVPMVYLMAKRSLLDSLQGTMELTLQTVQDALYEDNSEIKVQDSKTITKDIKPGIFVRVLSDDGTIIYESQDASWFFEDDFIWEESEYKWSRVTENVTVGSQTVTIDIAGSIVFNDYLNNLQLLLILAVPAFLLLAALGSMVLSKKALAPIRKITNTARRISNDDLSGRIEGINTQDEVAELAETFNSMIERLEVSFKRERQFTSDASHELRTPMAVITACTEDALSCNDPLIKEENLLMIQKENERMTKMLSQLLMLSRGYEGRYHFEPEDLLIYDMAESVAESMRQLADEKSITIHNQIPENTHIYADQSLFTQLLVNLIENAIKYGHEDGNIWLECSNGIDEMVITIRDDGIGIEEVDLPHIFDRFYRADKARNRSGSGLGLSIAKWIVQLHGGDINAESNVDSGTKMNIHLPKQYFI